MNQNRPHHHAPQLPTTAAPGATHRILAAGLVALLIVGPSAALAAAPERPPAGTEVDETRTVAQRPRAPDACLSLLVGGVTVLLDRDALARQAAAKPAQWKTEAERMALIEGRRAAALLEAATPASGPKDGHGCSQVTQALDGEDQSVLLAHLERGQATVLAPGGGKEAVAAVAIRYLGTRCGPTCGRGHIMASVPGQARPFLVADWWVS